MSSIQPIVFPPDLSSSGRGSDVFRATRAQPIEPAVSPPAVILPRTAAWLNALTSTPSQEDAAIAESDPAHTASTQSSPDQATQAQAGQSAYAQSVTAASAYALTGANAAAAPTSGPSQDASTPGFGSVVQLV